MGKCSIVSTGDGWGDLHATKWQNSQDGVGDGSVSSRFNKVNCMLADPDVDRSNLSVLVLTAGYSSTPQKIWKLIH